MIRRICPIVSGLSLLVGMLSASAALQRATGAIPPPDRTNLEAKRIADRYVGRLGDGYVARHDPARSLVHVSALDPAHHAETVALLGEYSDAFCRTLAVSRPKWLITVLLPTAEDYRAMAPRTDVLGYYDPNEHLLVSVDRGSVLVHEFVHALHHADCAASQQSHPIWVSEGLATLFESSKTTPTGIKPYVDARVDALQRAIRTGDYIPLSRLLAAKADFWMNNAELSYAEARYLMLYLHECGKLKTFYRVLKSSWKKDRTGKTALETALGKKLSRIEKDWLAWAEDLKMPWGLSDAHQGRLGLRVRDTRDGVKVMGFDPGSAAEVADRLKVGDIILEFDGHEINSSAGLVAAIRSAGAMRTVSVSIRRKGRRIVVRQPLASPNAQYPFTSK